MRWAALRRQPTWRPGMSACAGRSTGASLCAALFAWPARRWRRRTNARRWPVSDRFPLPTPDTPPVPPAADIDWRQVFVDPRQQRLIDLALQNNRDLRVAALNIEQAQARATIQERACGPR